MKTRTVTPEEVTLPLDRYPHIEFGVTLAAVTPKCIMCGKEIGPRAKTCGSNCRKRASRRKETIQREVQNVQNALDHLASLIDRWPDLEYQIMDALNDCVTAATVTYFGTDAE